MSINVLLDHTNIAAEEGFDTTASRTNFYNVTCVLVAGGRGVPLQDAMFTLNNGVRRKTGGRKDVREDIMRAGRLQIVVFFWQGNGLGLAQHSQYAGNSR